jgi:hypothetical protein
MLVRDRLRVTELSYQQNFPILGYSVEGTQKERQKEEAKSQNGCASDSQDSLQVFRGVARGRTRKGHRRF